jgi:CHAD domain-containing protein/uncharacterized protein YjbK
MHGNGARRTIAVEIEAKFSIPDEGTFQRLLGTATLAGFRLGNESSAEFHDHYLDTPAGAIRAQGFALRMRHVDDRYVATLKGLGGTSGAIHYRLEHEVVLESPTPPQEWPASSARDLALRLSKEAPLSTLFELRQTRHSRLLHKGDRAVAQLNLDRVRVYFGKVQATTYLELELELRPDGRTEDLEEMVREIQERWGLAPQSTSKFQRGLALLRPEPELKKEIGVQMDAQQEFVELRKAPGIQPDDPMSEAGRKTFRFHYQRMLLHEPGTRQGEDIEALHDMRVATRRMRAAFRIFGDYYERKAVTPYLKGLKRTGRALGPVRDLDVFREKMQAYIDTLPESKQGDLYSYMAVLQARREQARERMLAYLDSEKHTRFKVRFGEFVETEGMGSLPVAPDGGEPWPFRVHHVVPVAVYERLAAVRAYDEWVTIPDPPLERLHALRIACKRLRYTLEFFAEVLGADTEALIKEIVAMQDHLGAAQDALVASDILREYLASVTPELVARGSGQELEKLAAFSSIEAYLAARQEELSSLLQTFPAGWQRIRSAEFSRMVAEAIVVL